jgi:hypothetical protein
MTHAIEIDFDVYKLIEAERRGFNDSPLAALRRLLKLGEATRAPSQEQPSGRPWVHKGLSLPHGTALRMEYNRHIHEGQVVDGRWLVEGQLYDSPSAAAVGVARTKNGVQTTLNGWHYWQVQQPGSNRWVQLKYLSDKISSGHL